jgi:uncharacterized protein YraI
MKWTLHSLVAAAGLLVGLALPASANAYYAGTEGAVALRAGPGVNFKRITVIPSGVSIWVDFCQPRWCKVTWRSLSGWVSAAYVSGRYVAPREPYPDYGLFDDYYYYGYPYYPHRHHHHHRPPKPPHCDGANKCKPPKWEKPWDNKPPKWTKPWNGPQKNWNGPRKEWNGPTMWKQNDGPKSFDQGGPKFDVPRFRDNDGPPRGDFDGGGDRGHGRKKWND